VTPSRTTSADAVVEQVAHLDQPVAAVAVGTSGAAIIGSEGAVVVLGASGARTETTVPASPLAAAWNPVSAELAVGSPVGAVIVASDGVVRVVCDAGWCQALAWSPDGTMLAAGQGRWAVVVDVDGAPVWSAEAPSTVTDLAWTGRRLAVSAYGGVVLHEPRSGRVAQTMPFKGSLLVLATSPDGRWVTTGNQDASLHAWRIGRDNDELTMQGYATKVTALAFSPDSRLLACNGAHEVSVWDFAGKGPSGTAPRIMRGHEEFVSALAWSRDGRLATIARDRRVCVFDPLKGLPGRPLRPAATIDTEAAPTALAWLDPDTIIVGLSDGAVQSHRLIA
jgi:WD40 repeat protein